MRVKFALLIMLALAVLASGRSAKKPEEDHRKEQKKEEEKEKNKESVEAETEDEDVEDGESAEVDLDEMEKQENQYMTACLKQENVTENEMKNFLLSRGTKGVREPLKKVIFCFLKKINFFDGKTWNLEVISQAVGDDTDMYKAITDCLKKDDKKLQAHERTYRVQKCVLELDNI